MTDKPAWLRAHGKPWTPGTERLAFESGWIRVTEQTAIAPTGRPSPYGLVAKPGIKMVSAASATSRTIMSSTNLPTCPLRVSQATPLEVQTRCQPGRHDWISFNPLCGCRLR